MKTVDQKWMQHALELARSGRGFVEPNPMVGAVIVCDGEMIGEGFHERFGGPHAEINALQQAGSRAKGGTLYVTLEPCCHFGKTPPCGDALIHAGIQRTVIAMTDPFPQVAGQGVSKLVAAGVAVEVGCCEIEARELNRPYVTLLEKARPHVHLKWAMSLDGKIAARTGDSKWISNERSRAIVHELRGQMDAIIVGANTVRYDDPLLTARPAGARIPARIVLATHPRLPPDCQLLKTLDQAPVVVVSKEPGIIPGVEVIPQTTIAELLQELGRRRMTNVLVEGGATVLGSFLDAKLVDEVHVFVAPKLIGGGQSPIGGLGVERISESLCLTKCDVQRVGDDLYIHGVV